MGFGDLPAGGLTFTKFWNGAVDTPSDFPWSFESPLPFTEDGAIWFSHVFINGAGEREVYVIDRSDTNFWRYNINRKRWTKLANPNYDAESCERSLVINPTGSKVWCISDRRNPGYTNGSRLSCYDIAQNTWTDSAQAPDVPGLGLSALCSFCFADDDDEIWVWARDRNNLTGCCLRYVPSTTTWTAFANVTGVQNYWQAFNAGYAAGVVFGGGIGFAGGYQYWKYTIATDTYAAGVTHSPWRFCQHQAGDYMPYYQNITFRLGYLKVSDETFHDDFYPVNAIATKGYSPAFSLDLLVCLNWAWATSPEIMSYIGTGMWKLAEITLSGFNLLVFYKTNDGFCVSAIETTKEFHVPVPNYDCIALPAGTWAFYYPKDGDYTKVDLYRSALE